MSPKILVPTDDPEGKHVAPHFGRAAYFAVFDLDDVGTLISSTVHENTGSHRGGKGHAHDNVMALSPQVVIVGGMGPRGIRSFQDAGVAVLKADSNEVEKILESYSKGLLSELTEGCSDAHHK
jgi:predicted Fe-Mo cluster-binding NifX family protein